jgi:hypothetical protein
MSSVFRLPSIVAVLCLTATSLWSADRPAGWGGMSEGYVFERDTETKHGGSSSGLIRSTVEAPGKNATFVQKFKAENYLNRRVRFSGFLKLDGVNAGCYLWMRVDGQEMLNLAFDNMSTRRIKGTNDWTKCEIVLDVPQNAESITLGASLTGTGKLWTDDFALELVGLEVNSTDMKIPQRPNNQPAVTPNARKEIANPDFEK